MGLIAFLVGSDVGVEGAELRLRGDGLTEGYKVGFKLRVGESVGREEGLYRLFVGPAVLLAMRVGLYVGSLVGLLVACTTGVRVGGGVGDLGTSKSEIPDLRLLFTCLSCLFFRLFTANTPPAYSSMSSP